MSHSQFQGPQPRPLVEVMEDHEDYAFGQLFRVLRARLRYRHFDGSMSAPVTRISFERGDSVGVLLYDPHDDAVILVRQFRYPAFAGLVRDHPEGVDERQAWLLEVIAGVQDAGLTAIQVANKEMLEEAGFAVRGDLEPIATFYVSPGGSSERIHLFLGLVDQRRRAGPGGGVVVEGEDIQIIVLPLVEAKAMIVSGEICDAKTIIGLQHLALRLAR